MKQISIVLIARARPDVMKVAQLSHALSVQKESATEGWNRPARIHRPHRTVQRPVYVGSLLPRAGDACAGQAPRRGA